MTFLPPDPSCQHQPQQDPTERSRYEAIAAAYDYLTQGQNISPE